VAFRWVGVPRAIILLSILAIAWGTRLGTRWPAIYYMTGPSMEPTVRARELFVTWSPAGSLVRGDLVIFEFQDADGDFHVLRRVVGLPGDTLAMQDGTLFLNGRRAPWPFRVLAPGARISPFALVSDLYTWGPWVVPRDSVFLLSDTRDHLGWPDSRFIGPVPAGRVIARATRTVTGRPLARARSP
jgi:signal peptidase I